MLKPSRGDRARLKIGVERIRSIRVIIAALSRVAEVVSAAVTVSNTRFLPVGVEANW